MQEPRQKQVQKTEVVLKCRLGQDVFEENQE